MRYLCLIFVCAAALQAQGRFDGKLIREIRFEGLSELSSEYLKTRIKSTEGGAYESLLISEDIRRLYNLGDFLGDIRVRVQERPDGGLVLTFEVRERRVCTSVQLLGHDELEDILEEHPTKKFVADFLHIRSGDLYNRYFVDVDRKWIADTYKRAGFLFVDVQVRLEPADGGVDLIYVVHEGPQVLLEEVIFEGNGDIKRQDLIDHMQTKAYEYLGLLYDGEYNPETLEEDLVNLEIYCRSRGYLNARVWLADMSFSDDQQWLTLTIRVEPGRLFKVERIEIIGATLFSEDTIKSRMRQKEGVAFNGEVTQQDVNIIRALYSSKAHLFAQVRLDLHYTDSDNGCVVSFTLDEGEPITVERIDIRGNLKTKDKVIRRQLTLRPGDLYDSNKMSESVNNLGRLSYFSGIDTDFTDASTPDRRNLVLEVEEGETGQIGLGGGFSSAFGFSGSISLVQNNFDITRVPGSFRDVIDGRAFAGGGQSFRIDLRPGNQRSSYSVSFQEPFFLDTNFSLGLSAFLYQRFFRDYTDSRLGMQVEFGRHLNLNTTVTLGYRLEDIFIGEIDADAVADVIEVAGQSALSLARLGIKFDYRRLSRDLLVTGGWAYDTRYEVAGGYLGGTWDFHRALATADYYTTVLQWPYEYPHIFHFRGQAGWADAYGGQEELPIFERFYSGGPTTIRGFQHRSVGPQEDDRPVGGEAMLRGTAEYSFPLYKSLLRGVFFIDAGAVETEWKDWSFNRLRVSVGTGIRLRLPIFPAPLSLDFGVPLELEETDDREFFHINFGFGI